MNATDLVLAVGVAGAALVAVAVLPLERLQALLWAAAFLVIVVGDSATTALIRRYDDLEEGGPATRRVCGPNPSPRCALLTRLAFFTVAAGLYTLVAVFGVGSRVGVVATSATAFPLILTVAGLVVVVWNAVEIVAAERRRPPPIERF